MPEMEVIGNLLLSHSCRIKIIQVDNLIKYNKGQRLWFRSHFIQISIIIVQVMGNGHPYSNHPNDNTVSGNDIMAGYGHGYGHKCKSSGLGIFSFLLMLVYLLRFGAQINHKGVDRV